MNCISEDSRESVSGKKEEIQETIDKLVRQGNRCEDQITKYQAEMAKAGSS